MKIVKAFPPNYAELVRVFPIRGKAIYFCYGDTVFNPSGTVIDGPLRAHEAVHSRRQGNDPAAWWRRYIDDKHFRLDEELLAHRAEFGARLLCGQGRKSAEGLALRLSSDIYGKMISYASALAFITEKAE